jgi:ribosomal protein L32
MKGRQRRSHYHASVSTITLCTKCGNPIRRHSICPKCFKYRNREFPPLSSKEMGSEDAASAENAPK